MTLQVVIHGIPLRSRPGTVRPGGWLRGVRALFRRQVLRLEPHSLGSVEEKGSRSPQSTEDLGMWVGAIQVRQMPTREETPRSRLAQSPRLPAADFSALQEGHKVNRIFAQNQITGRSTRSASPSPRSGPRTGPQIPYPPRMAG